MSVELEDRVAENLLSEMKELRREIRAYRKRFRREVEEIIESTIIDRFLNPLFEQELKRLDREMNGTLPTDCDLRGKCKEEFHKFFEKFFEENKKGETELKKLVEDKVSELRNLEESMPYDRCEYCFETAFELLDRETELIGALDLSTDYSGLSEEKNNIMSAEIVDDVLSPLANEVRIDILGELTEGSKSFSELSEATDLRGGNPTFHLNQLREKGFIVQKHPGGEYWITEEGQKVTSALRSLSELSGK